MAPLVCGPFLNLRGDGGAWRSILPGCFVSIIFLFREVYLPPQAQGKSVIAGRCPLF